MRLHFTKMHGAGNDFVIFDARQARPADHCDTLDPDAVSSGFLATLADRHRGIGCDQILLLEDSGTDDIVASYRIFNADGGEVRQCGNGARCLARYLADTGTQGRRISLSSAGGTVHSRLTEDAVSISLGVPDFSPRALPMDAPHREQTYRLVVDNQDVSFGAVSMGNPHAVIMVKDPDTAPVATIGAKLCGHPFFPQGVNVGFARVDNRRQLSLRVFERGAGETRACGTGAAAAAAVAIDAGLVDTDLVVEQPGGQLMVSWAAPDEPLWLTGPAVRVFEGYIDL